MGLIRTKKKEPTLEEKQNAFKEFVIENLTVGFNGVSQIQSLLFNQIWNNQDGLSPQECFDGLGEDAVALLTAADLVNKMLPVLKADHVGPEAPNEIEVDKNGKVIVGKVKEKKE